jgi:hypothetical protein
MLINIGNVEDLIFFNSELHSKLPDFALVFRQWKMSRTYGLRSLARQAIFDFLNGINESHVVVLEEYFGQDIIINSVDYSLVKNMNFDMDNPEVICSINGYTGFSTYRKGSHIYISFWR